MPSGPERVLVTTVTGWRATIRSVRWSPMFVTPLALGVALVVVRTLADPAQGNMTLLGETSLAFTAVTAAFIADDIFMEAAPATPTEAWFRLVVRAGVAGPVIAAGWLLVLVVYDSVSAVPVTADIASRGMVGLGLGSMALALATACDRRWAVASPGVAGLGAMACLALTWRILPEVWLKSLPPAEVLWPVTIVLALGLAVVATREPRS